MRAHKIVVLIVLVSIFLISGVVAAELRGSISQVGASGITIDLDEVPSEPIKPGSDALISWDSSGGFPIDLGEATIKNISNKTLAFEWKTLYGDAPQVGMAVILEEIAVESSSDVEVVEDVPPVKADVKADVPAIAVTDQTAAKGDTPKVSEPKPKPKSKPKKEIPDKKVDAQTDDVKTVDDDAEIAFWESIRDSDDPRVFEAYLAEYPKGKFASLARIKFDASLKKANESANAAQIEDQSSVQKEDDTKLEAASRSAVVLKGSWESLKDEKELSAVQQLKYIQDSIVSSISAMNVDLTVNNTQATGDRRLKLVLSRKKKILGLTSKYYLYLDCTDAEGRKFWSEKERTLRGASLVATLDKLLELMGKKIKQRSGLPCLGN